MDNLQPGPADFQLHVDDVRDLPTSTVARLGEPGWLTLDSPAQLTLHLDIYRNQVFVASFNSSPIAFVLAPGTTEGSGTFT